MGDSGGSVVSIDVERISFGGKVRTATTLPRLFLSAVSAVPLDSFPPLVARAGFLTLGMSERRQLGVVSGGGFWGENGLGSRNFFVSWSGSGGCIASALLSQHLVSSSTYRFLVFLLTGPIPPPHPTPIVKAE
jgi:hypothetical protein